MGRRLHKQKPYIARNIWSTSTHYPNYKHTLYVTLQQVVIVTYASSDPGFSIIGMRTLLSALHYYQCFNYQHLCNKKAVYYPRKLHKITQKSPHVLPTIPTY